MTVGSPRRYYLGKRQQAEQSENDLADVWRAKQEAESGEELPDDFPYAERLAEAGYVAFDDLDGADAAELVAQGFTTREATAILAAAEDS